MLEFAWTMGCATGHQRDGSFLQLAKGVYPHWLEARQTLDEVLRDAPYYLRTNGGCDPVGW